MMLHRAKVVLGIVTAAVTILWLVSLPASASQYKSTKGSDPHGPFCKFYKSETSSTSKSTQALQKAIDANNWPLAKKDIIAEFGTVGMVHRELTR
jgi:hypothetical protein